MLTTRETPGNRRSERYAHCPVYIVVYRVLHYLCCQVRSAGGVFARLYTCTYHIDLYVWLKKRALYMLVLVGCWPVNSVVPTRADHEAGDGGEEFAAALDHQRPGWHKLSAPSG